MGEGGGREGRGLKKRVNLRGEEAKIGRQRPVQVCVRRWIGAGPGKRNFVHNCRLVGKTRLFYEDASYFYQGWLRHRAILQQEGVAPAISSWGNFGTGGGARLKKKGLEV